jgi:hypothetical protein
MKAEPQILKKIKHSDKLLVRQWVNMLERLGCRLFRVLSTNRVNSKMVQVSMVPYF